MRTGLTGGGVTGSSFRVNSANVVLQSSLELDLSWLPFFGLSA